MNYRLFLLLLLTLVAACGREPATVGHDDHEEHSGHAGDADEFERGSHGGRLLRDGGFAIEVTIFEAGTPPRFRLYATRDGKPLLPTEVQARIELTRLGGEVDTFEFVPENDYLLGDGIVEEPHSFDVVVDATHGTQHATWRYAAHEGRTSIAPDVARESGIEVGMAGPALIRDTVHVLGTVTIDASRHARVKARFPGIVRQVPVQEGQRVRRGDPLVLVEGNDSLRTYTVTAPIDGVVLARHTSPGDVSGDAPLVELADLSQLWVDLRGVGREGTRLRAGQAVRIQSATSDAVATGVIERLLPVATAGQGVIARVRLSNPEGHWRPGMTVTAEVTVAAREVPLAVQESALQAFRDFTVVFAQFGDTYEVRMLELGARDGEHAEVLSGIAPGTTYVTEQSYLIRADIEKSGASHDH